ncbi:MAG TPA: hypothetical protein VE338_21395 [Ktedonobacterales bacterium]|jgi:hypothetical protein|nr:hypothetical protein [Ktedonobacterales bacterium]
MSNDAALTMRWAPVYQQVWDDTPDAYVAAGVVGWERTRRLLRADDSRLGMKAYIGVRHSDPTRWGLPGEPRAVFFLSLLLGKQTLFLRSYPTIPEALAELHAAHARLAERLSGEPRPR